MTKYWEKKGLIYAPKKGTLHPKLLSHAANPLPIYLHGNVYRIFFSGRDKFNRSSVGAVDIDIVLCKIVEEHYLPFFEHGQAGSFFADGISIGNCYSINNDCYMLFMGWQNSESGHWRGDIGRLIVTPELTLELDSHLPFLGSNQVDPISLSYPWVLPRSLGGFDMWYGSTRTWDAGNGEMLHIIQHASSDDGHCWNRSGLSLPYEIGCAQAFSRPTVIKNPDGGFEMWFSYRGDSRKKYLIGYATSNNGLDWTLKLDEAGITVSAYGWDSEMIEYPFVFNHGSCRYMLYNGNGYGITGFGLAVFRED